MTTTSCEHRQIFNAKWECRECGTKMVARRDVPQRLLAGSAPNAPSVLTGFEVIYDCEHCSPDKTGVCGNTHRGEYLNAAGKSRRG